MRHSRRGQNAPHSAAAADVAPPAGSRPRHWAGWLGRNWARWTYGRHVEPTWLELTRHAIPVAGLSPALHRFRIVQLSDLHGGKGVPLHFLEEAVAVANAQQPDVVAVTGDFIHKGFRYVERVAELVRRLKARHGVYAVLGNHDFSVRNALGIRRHKHLHRTMEEALAERGVAVLRNRSMRLEHGEGRLHLAGVDDLWSGGCDLKSAFAGLSPAEPCVLLAHNPHTVGHLDGERCDLILSGHTHGGQVDWPGLGRFTLSKKAKRYAAGMYRVRDSYLYVNRGVGFGFRFRFGVRPEVALFELHAVNAAS